MEDQETRKRNLRPFWILLAVCGVPYLLSWVYFANIEHIPNVSTNNKGNLVEPVRPIAGLDLTLSNGDGFSTNSLKGNWTLVSAGNSTCDEPCQKNIYHMRQIRRLMGKERTRIQRLFVLLDSTALDDFIQKVEPYGDMLVVLDSSKNSQQLLEKMTVNGQRPDDRIFIVDPMGNLMMAYNGDINPELIAKDFRRLLTVTRIGKPKASG